MKGERLLIITLVVILSAAFSCKEEVPVSNAPPVAQLDTTSHDMIWRVDTIGFGFGSSLRDVCIINDSCIYAVGRIVQRDSSTGTGDPNIYNVLKWDGRMWEKQRVFTATSYGASSNVPIAAVYGISTNNIFLISDVGGFAGWNGSSWNTFWISQRSGSIRKIWASSPNNIYLVGGNGTITRYDGNQWTQLLTNTSVDLNDISGTSDGLILYAVGYSSSDGNSILMRIPRSYDLPFPYYSFINGVETPRSDRLCAFCGFRGSLSSVSVTERGTLWVAGGHVYRKNQNSDTARAESQTFTQNGGSGIQIWSPRASLIRGTKDNDMWVYGDSLYHWNGASWKSFNVVSSASDVIRGMSVTSSMVALVGSRVENNTQYALIITGRRR
jgi:hypothetical protein